MYPVNAEGRSSMLQYHLSTIANTSIYMYMYIWSSLPSTSDHPVLKLTYICIDVPNINHMCGFKTSFQAPFTQKRFH